MKKTRANPGIKVLILVKVIFALLAGLPRQGVAETVNFSQHILPILSDNCFQCHGPDPNARQAGLRLDIPEGAFEIRRNHAIIQPGESEASELYRRLVASNPDEIMPPLETKRSLTPGQIELLKRWIDEGAVWGRHWAFEPVQRPEPPPVPTAPHSVRNPIDQFILDRLQREGLTPSPEAPRETLIRRVTLDLTGLPPAPEVVEAFLADESPHAYEKVVDRLLASPAFGERMAWDWLDAARYADSNGYQGDAERTMWPWRDWVVEAFNRNLAYDQFTLWQLAGDLLPNPTFEQRLATGFSRNHMINGEGGRIAEENRVDYVMDMTETMGTVWMGLTLNCARCHDHKYDPVSNRDYYSLYAFFNQTPVTGQGGDPQTPPRLEMPTAEQTARLGELRREIEEAAASIQGFESALFTSGAGDEAVLALEENLQAILNRPPRERNRGQLRELEEAFQTSASEYAAELKRLREAIESRDGVQRSIVRVMVMEDKPEWRPTYILETGLYNAPREEVEADVPAVLRSLDSDLPRNRLGLAEWLISPEHPLTARVTVNRFWQQFFGTGLVNTPEDFGVQSEFPSHPELLDWLADEFVRSGWDVKRLCRLIVTSGTYRQSSAVTPQLLEIDPHNRLLARAPRFRLPSWMIRDQALAAAGLLERRMGGAPVRPYQPAGVWEEATFGTKQYRQDSGEKLYRRSLYTFWRRIIAPTHFFDAASRQVCSVKPPLTNTPLHALTTLNDITYVEAARALAQRVLISAPPDPAARLDLAFRLVLARPPSAEEKRVLSGAFERLFVEFAAQPEEVEHFLSVGESPRNKEFNSVEHAALAGVCMIILNLDETLTKE